MKHYAFLEGMHGEKIREISPFTKKLVESAQANDYFAVRSYNGSGKLDPKVIIFFTALEHGLHMMDNDSVQAIIDSVRTPYCVAFTESGNHDINSEKDLVVIKKARELYYEDDPFIADCARKGMKVRLRDDEDLLQRDLQNQRFASVNKIVVPESFYHHNQRLEKIVEGISEISEREVPDGSRLFCSLLYSWIFNLEETTFPLAETLQRRGIEYLMFASTMYPSCEWYVPLKWEAQVEKKVKLK